ncbi:MAG: helicase RepA family protein [Desulfobulbaceae bacterium]|nr:helicase RepA family protein [Desulfobulbaceae bacterium]
MKEKLRRSQSTQGDQSTNEFHHDHQQETDPNQGQTTGEWGPERMAEEMRSKAAQEEAKFGGGNRDSVNSEDSQKQTESSECGRSFRFIPATEILTVKPVEWLVKEFLEAGVLAVMFGDPESYKSFIALDMACCIATHRPWHGHFTKKGPVFVILGEGAGGYGRRLAAWQKGKMRSLEDAPIFVSTAPAQILNEASAGEVAEALQSLRDQHGDPSLLVIDTLARNFGPGDENSTADMTRFINHLDRHIGNTFTRLLIHHSGLGDKTRGRGSSVLRGAVDAELRTTRRDDGTVELSCTKMKDAPPFPPITFKPEVVVIGQDGNEPITSLYLEKTDPPAQEAPKLSGQMEDALRLLALMDGKSCRIHKLDWMEFCLQEKVYNRTSLYRAIDEMCDKGFIEKTGDCVKLSHQSHRVASL